MTRNSNFGINRHKTQFPCCLYRQADAVILRFLTPLTPFKSPSSTFLRTIYSKD